MIEVLFYVFAAVALGGALGVVWAKSPVGSLLYMVATLASLACIFVLLEAHFLAAIQVIVYAGAIMVLFLFVIMLLNLGREQALPHFMKFQRASSVMLVILFFFGVSLIMLEGSGELHQPIIKFSAGSAYALGEALFTKFLLPFEVASLLLLVALIGTVYLAKRKI